MILKSFCSLRYFNTLNKNFIQAAHTAQLTDRNIIVVHGNETRKFMQGVVSNNIEDLYTGSKNEVSNDTFVTQYNMFLTAKGKVVSDGLVYRPIIKNQGKLQRKQNQLWIDVSSGNTQILLKHLKKYTWKKDVNLTVLSQQTGKPRIMACYSPSFLSMSQPEFDQISSNAGKINSFGNLQQTEQGNYVNLSYYDPRVPTFGVRIVSDHYDVVIQNRKQSTLQDYQKASIINGISSSQIMRNKLPFMFNADLFNGFSFNKGCYLGQELVARAYHTGIVRRRVFPYVSKNQSSKIQEGKIIYDDSKNQIGKVLQSYNGVGTVLCNYLTLISQKWPIKFSDPQQGIVITPFEIKLNRYLEQMQTKQNKLNQIDL